MKTQMRRSITAFIVAAAFVVQAVAQTAPLKILPAERKAAEAISARQLSEFLHFVASDEMEGRDTPSRGLDLTAKFIALNLARWGFKPAGDNGTFFQKIALRRDSIDPKGTSVTYNGVSYEYGEDVARVAGTGNAKAPVVYAGNGWMIRSKGLDPYAGVDVSGKFIAVFGEGPINGRNLVPLPAGVTQADLSGERGKDWADAVTYARTHGAVGVIVLPSKFLAGNWSAVTQNFGRSRMVPEKLVPQAPAGGQQQINILLASPKLAKAMFAGAKGDPMNGATETFELGADKPFEFTVATKAETAWTQNVVAIWEGGDPKLKSEMVAIGAHYDHVGMNPNAPGPDKIWNGADDDGSGTVAVLSIAEALAKAPARPKRSILLVWHCGEEKGLWGSDYFNKFPTVDIKQVTAQLNIDMIGRSKKPGDANPRNKELSDENTIYVIGKDMMSTTLGSVVDQTNSGYLKLAYDTRYDDPKDPNRFFFRSDHFNYAVNGIPVVFWFDGEHEDYHQPGDEADKIDYAKMEKVTRTIFLTMWKLAGLAARPAVDKKLPPELSQR